MKGTLFAITAHCDIAPDGQVAAWSPQARRARMILSDRYAFVFVHIPKCAGTSVRAAVEPYHDADARFLKTVEEHPDLGPLDYRHMPLHILAQVDAEAFAKLGQYQSYALVRDPLQRFRSAMAQRAKMYLGDELAQMKDAQLTAEIDKTISYLMSEPSVIRPEFIHFARQSDFIMSGDQQLVENVFPVERVDLLGAALAHRIGLAELPVAKANETKVFRVPALKRVLKAGSAMTKRIMPKGAHDAIRLAARHRMMKPVAQATPSAFLSDQVTNFVVEYYAQDARLHAQALAQHPA